MKNTITNFALVLIAFVAINLLMSFARPVAADEPKEYIVITNGQRKLEQTVNQKLAEGWHLQGGVSYIPYAVGGGGDLAQAMVK